MGFELSAINGNPNGPIPYWHVKRKPQKELSWPKFASNEPTRPRRRRPGHSSLILVDPSRLTITIKQPAAVHLNYEKLSEAQIVHKAELMKNLTTIAFCLLLSLTILPAQEVDDQQFDFWQERYRQAQSRTARSFVFQAAAKQADASALDFLKQWSKKAPKNEDGMEALTALGTTSAFPFPAFVFKIAATTPVRGMKKRILSLLVTPGPQRRAGYELLLQRLEIHQQDSHGLLLLDILTQFLKVPMDDGNIELHDLLLSIFEAPQVGPLHQATYGLSRELPDEIRNRFDISALLQLDPLFAKKAATNLINNKVDGVEDVMVSIFLEHTPGFFRAKLDDLLRDRSNLLLRLRFLDLANDMSWDQLEYLHACMSVSDDARMKVYLSTSLRSEGEKKKILALWMIRGLHHKSATRILESMRAETLTDSVSLLLHDTLALFTGDASHFEFVKKMLSKGKLDQQLQRLELAQRIHLGGPHMQHWLRRKIHETKGNWKIQGHLIRLAGDMKLPETIELCEQANLSKIWQVRLAAIESLVLLGTRPALTRLAALTNDPQERLARTASDGLRRLTGIDLGANPNGWRRLIATLGGSWTPRRTPVRELSFEDGSRYAPQFYGLDIRSNRVIFICDTSGSMKGRKIAELKRELWRSMRGIDAPESAFNAIFFARNTQAIWKRLAKVRKNTLDKAKKSIGRIQADGGTNVWAALERAFVDRDADTIVLLTDGQPSVGKIIDPEIILQSVAQLNRYKRLQIHTVYLSEDQISMRRNVVSSQTASYFMRRMADLGLGQYVEAK
ncbi:MAG: hypothetical protein ACI97A_003458 [Planctomycetota bacterium]|jgi:hypothetical protein